MGMAPPGMAGMNPGALKNQAMGKVGGFAGKLPPQAQGMLPPQAKGMMPGQQA